jgi:hypothetical protein
VLPCPPMSRSVDTFAIAARLRGLVDVPNFEGLDALAQRLRVPEFDLRMSLDDVAPQPTLEVLAAIVREYGVDPSWQIRGQYDQATHVAALDNETVTPITLLDLVAPPDRVAPEDIYEMRVELPVNVEPEITGQRKVISRTQGARRDGETSARLGPQHAVDALDEL